MEVIVLAGGMGTRLRSVVHECPKCMAPVGDRPFLAFLLDWLCRYPVDHVVFSVGYLKEQVIDWVQAREWPFRYHFAVEETPLGTGGGIRLALGCCEESQIFVVNGDTFFPVDLQAMPFDGPVTIALKPLRDFDRYGLVSVRETAGRLQVTAFHEKAPCKAGLISGGVYALDRSRLQLEGFPERFSFEKDYLEPGAAEAWVSAWCSDAYFIDIGVPEDYAHARQEIPEWFAVQRASDAVMASDADFLFLDRDGVINRLLPGDYVKSWDEFHFLPGILQALALWAGRFQRIVLVSNQRGVGKGVMTDRDLSRIHARMMMEIMDAGGRLDLILTATSADENHPDRKPNTGMFRQACALFPDISAGRSIMIGDAPSDAAFAQNCQMAFVQL